MLSSTTLGSKSTSVLRFIVPFAGFSSIIVALHNWHRKSFTVGIIECSLVQSEVKLSTHHRAVICTWPYSVCSEFSCGTTRAGIMQISNFVAKITSLIDCLRYMIDVGWNPHNMPMEKMQKQLHGR